MREIIRDLHSGDGTNRGLGVKEARTGLDLYIIFFFSSDSTFYMASGRNVNAIMQYI